MTEEVARDRMLMFARHVLFYMEKTEWDSDLVNTFQDAALNLGLAEVTDDSKFKRSNVAVAAPTDGYDCTVCGCKKVTA